MSPGIREVPYPIRQARDQLTLSSANMTLMAPRCGLDNSARPAARQLGPYLQPPLESMLPDTYVAAPFLGRPTQEDFAMVGCESMISTATKYGLDSLEHPPSIGSSQCP